MWVKPHFYQSFLFDSTPFPHLTPPTAAHRLNILIKFFGPGGKPATLYKTMYKFTKYLGLCSSKWMPSIAPGNEPNSVHTINWPESDTQLKISACISFSVLFHIDTTTNARGEPSAADYALMPCLLPANSNDKFCFREKIR